MSCKQSCKQCLAEQSRAMHDGKAWQHIKCPYCKNGGKPPKARAIVRGETYDLPLTLSAS